MEIIGSWRLNHPDQSVAILRLLNHKLGTLPDLLVKQIRSLSPAQLDSPAEDLLDFNIVADLQVWLINS